MSDQYLNFDFIHMAGLRYFDRKTDRQTKKRQIDS